MFEQIMITDLTYDETGRWVEDELYHPVKLVDEAFDLMWAEAARRFQLHSGDFSPYQTEKEEQLRKAVAKLMLEYIKQNS